MEHNNTGGRKMKATRGSSRGRTRDWYFWRIGLIILACSAVYYLPVLAHIVGWTSAEEILNRFHDFYGIDFFALVFFAPVVYAAYTVGITYTLAVAMLSMVLLLPYALTLEGSPSTVFRPTSFAIILSAVGAVVAMLKKSDEQGQRSTEELQCLYEIGRLVESSGSVDDFVYAVTDAIPHLMRRHGEIRVRVSVRDRVFEPPGFSESVDTASEDMIGGGGTFGRFDIQPVNSALDSGTQRHLARILAERISSGIRAIELQRSLDGYYEQLEEMVEKRTRDLEETQERLVRSERLAAVGELASGVGHEIRNPLNVIRNCVYLLKITLDGKADGEIVRTLDILDQQVDSANWIVSDLLDFTRLSPPVQSRIDLNQLVTERLSGVTVPEAVMVTTDTCRDFPEVLVDSEQVGRAIVNIISNAIQAMKNSGELMVNTGVDGNFGWIRFEDSGCGIPEEALGKIFEPLYTTKPKGIGLGLAITKRLVEQNDGSIEVESQVSRGTVFTIKLPLTERES